MASMAARAFASVTTCWPFGRLTTSGSPGILMRSIEIGSMVGSWIGAPFSWNRTVPPTRTPLLAIVAYA